MTIRLHLFAIASLMISLVMLGCDRQTQSLYKVEVERSCQNCDLRGVNFSGQSLGGKYRVSVSNQPLSTNPEGLGYAEPVDLTGSDLRDTDFSNATLSEVILNSTQLADANLQNANLEDAQLVNADLRNADLKGANLSGANFQNANLSGADLRDCDLQVANLDGADLTGALTGNTDSDDE